MSIDSRSVVDFCLFIRPTNRQGTYVLLGARTHTHTHGRKRTFLVQRSKASLARGWQSSSSTAAHGWICLNKSGQSDRKFIEFNLLPYGHALCRHLGDNIIRALGARVSPWVVFVYVFVCLLLLSGTGCGNLNGKQNELKNQHHNFAQTLDASFFWAGGPALFHFTALAGTAFLSFSVFFLQNRNHTGWESSGTEGVKKHETHKWY